MIDFTKADKSKNHKKSFDAASRIILEYIENLRERYFAKWNEIEGLRKERSNIIEKDIRILKNAGLKLSTPLGPADNEFVINQLKDYLNSLSFTDKEEIECDIIKINNRYERITVLGQELDEINSELSKFTIGEDDENDEVEINLEQELLSTNQKEKKISKIHKNEKEKKRISLFSTDQHSTKNSGNIHKEVILNGQTLSEIVNQVYSSEKYVKNIYAYSDNHIAIDDICKKKNITVEKAMTQEPLINVKIKLPLEIEVQEEL